MIFHPYFLYPTKDYFLFDLITFHEPKKKKFPYQAKYTRIFECGAIYVPYIVLCAPFVQNVQFWSNANRSIKTLFTQIVCLLTSFINFWFFLSIHKSIIWHSLIVQNVIYSKPIKTSFIKLILEEKTWFSSLYVLIIRNKRLNYVLQWVTGTNWENFLVLRRFPSQQARSHLRTPCRGKYNWMILWECNLI